MKIFKKVGHSLLTLSVIVSGLGMNIIPGHAIPDGRREENVTIRLEERPISDNYIGSTELVYKDSVSGQTETLPIEIVGEGNTFVATTYPLEGYKFDVDATNAINRHFKFTASIIQDGGIHLDTNLTHWNYKTTFEYFGDHDNYVPIPFKVVVSDKGVTLGTGYQETLTNPGEPSQTATIRVPYNSEHQYDRTIAILDKDKAVEEGLLFRDVQFSNLQIVQKGTWKAGEVSVSLSETPVSTGDIRVAGINHGPVFIVVNDDLNKDYKFSNFKDSNDKPFLLNYGQYGESLLANAGEEPHAQSNSFRIGSVDTIGEDSYVINMVGRHKVNATFNLDKLAKVKLNTTLKEGGGELMKTAFTTFPFEVDLLDENGELHSVLGWMTSSSKTMTPNHDIYSDLDPLLDYEIVDVRINHYGYEVVDFKADGLNVEIETKVLYSNFYGGDHLGKFFTDEPVEFSLMANGKEVAVATANTSTAYNQITAYLKVSDETIPLYDENGVEINYEFTLRNQEKYKFVQDGVTSHSGANDINTIYDYSYFKEGFYVDSSSLKVVNIRNLGTVQLLAKTSKTSDWLNTTSIKGFYESFDKDGVYELEDLFATHFVQPNGNEAIPITTNDYSIDVMFNDSDAVPYAFFGNITDGFTLIFQSYKELQTEITLNGKPYDTEIIYYQDGVEYARSDSPNGLSEIHEAPLYSLVTGEKHVYTMEVLINDEYVLINSSHFEDDELSAWVEDFEIKLPYMIQYVDENMTELGLDVMDPVFEGTEITDIDMNKYKPAKYKGGVLLTDTIIDVKDKVIIVQYVPVEDIPWLPLEPSIPLIPWLPLEPSTPIIPWLPLEPSKPVLPLIPLEPSTPITPLIPLVPAKPIVPLVPLEPAKPVVPLIPLEPSVPVEEDIPEMGISKGYAVLGLSVFVGAASLLVIDLKKRKRNVGE